MRGFIVLTAIALVLCLPHSLRAHEANIAPSLLRVAMAAMESKDWRAEADRFALAVDERGRIQVALDANARYQTWIDGTQVRPALAFPAGFDEWLAAQFSDLQVLPESTQRYFVLRAAPADLVELAALSVEAVKTSALVPYNPARTTFGGVVSQGVPRTRATTFHDSGVAGQGMAIGVLDLGFRGVQGRVAGEIGAYQSPVDLQLSGHTHGTACAEIVRDVAPGAELHLYPVYETSVEGAVAHALANGVNIMTVSLAWMGYPENGPECDAARMAISNGMAWVNSSGNWRERMYWESAPQTDAVRFGGDATLNQVVAVGGLVEVGFSYEAPDESYARYQLVLHERRNGMTEPVAYGSPGTFYQLVSYASVLGASYFVSIELITDGTPGRLRLQSFTNRFEYFTQEGSASNPATVPEVIAVGAVHHTRYGNDIATAAYSSMGGGVFSLDIDVCGPTGTDSLTFDGAFHGTSAAAPHVAGLLALQGSLHGNLDVLALALLDAGPPGWDPAFGHGLARLSGPDLGQRLVLTHPLASRLPDAAVGQPYLAVEARAIGGSGQHTYMGENLPPGIAINRVGQIEGTATEAGEWTAIIGATDAASRTVSRQYRIRVLPAGSMLITSPVDGQLPSGTVHSPYTPLRFLSAGGTASFSLSWGVLPPGLSLSSSGELVGHPNVAGEWGFNVRAVAPDGAAHERAYLLRIDGPNPLGMRSSWSACVATHTRPTGLALLGLVALVLALRRARFFRALI